MTIFQNVSIIKKANVYFDGKVNSRSIHFADGSLKTLGFMQAGEYTFKTADAEIMEILAGELDVSLPEQATITVKAGESFSVPANSEFTVNVKQSCDYCCSFIPS